MAAPSAHQALMRAIQDAGPLTRTKARLEREMADLESKLAKLRQQYDDASAKLQTRDCRVLELQTAQRSQWTTTEDAELAIFALCQLPGVPLLAQTCRAFWLRIQAWLRAGELVHMRLPRDSSSVQAAIDMAPVGGRIALSRGIYDGAVQIRKAVELRGEDGADITVLTGGCSLHPTVGGATLLTGLSFTTTRGSYALTLSNSDATVNDCLVSGVRVDGQKSNPQLRGCKSKARRASRH